MKTRDSRIELLRIVACVMILAHHIIQHSGPTTNSLIYSEFSANQLFSTLIGSWGQLGVTIFIIISAWYMLEKSGGCIKLSNICNLAIQTWVICLGMTTIYVIANNHSYSMSLIFKELVTPFYYGQYWFVTTYIVYYLTSPLLRRAVTNMPLRVHKYLCIVFTFFVPFYNWFFTNVGGRLAYFYFIYISVAYLKRHPNNILERNRRIIGICSFIFTVIAMIACTLVKPLNGLMSRFQDCNNLTTYLIGISLFYSFLHFPRMNSKLINIIASGSLGVYLLSENYVISGALSKDNNSLWNHFFKIGEYYHGDTLQFIIRVVGTIIISYFLCIIIDKARGAVHKKTFENLSWIQNMYRKIDTVIANEEEHK